MSPAMIVEGRPRPDFSQNIIAFGACDLVHIGTTNIIKTWDIPTIDLRINSAGR